MSKQTNDSDVIRVERPFTGFPLEHNIPLTALDHVGPLLHKMFLTSDVAKRYGCARTKTTAILGEMAKNAQNCMVFALKQIVFSVAINGSNDSHLQFYLIPHPQLAGSS